MDYKHQQLVSFQSIDQIVEQIKDGDTIAIGGFWFVRLPIALIDALVKKQVGNLTIITQASGLALEQFIAARLVKKVIFSFISLDIFGLAPCFRKAVENKEIEWEEWNALRMNQALEAGRQNLPSYPIQAPFGSCFSEEHKGFTTSPCPITGETVGIVESIQPNVALIHAQKSDSKGNIQIQGSLGIDRLLMGASQKTFVSVEEIVHPSSFDSDPRSLIIPRFLINGICEVSGGAYPSSCLPYYVTDYWHLSDIIDQAKKDGHYSRIQIPQGETKYERIDKLHRFLAADANEFAKKLEAKELKAERDNDEPYTIDELLACVMSDEVKDNMVSTVGSNTPLSMVAYLLAKKMHAPNVVLIPFCGLNDIPVYPITMSLAEVFAFKYSSSHWAIEDLWQWIYQKSLTAIEFGSPAQIDRLGRINNSIIGSMDHMKVRLPGQAGLADVMNLHHHCNMYITRQSDKRMVDNVDFISGSREFLTNEEREKEDLPQGRYKLFTNLGIFEVDHSTRTFKLTHIHPNVSLADIQDQMGFTLEVSDSLKTTQEPTNEQLKLIRSVIDPFGFRKLEFASAAERTDIIRGMLDSEQILLFGEPILNFK